MPGDGSAQVAPLQGGLGLDDDDDADTPAQGSAQDCPVASGAAGPASGESAAIGREKLGPSGLRNRDGTHAIREKAILASFDGDHATARELFLSLLIRTVEGSGFQSQATAAAAHDYATALERAGLDPTQDDVLARVKHNRRNTMSIPLTELAEAVEQKAKEKQAENYWEAALAARVVNLEDLEDEPDGMWARMMVSWVVGSPCSLLVVMLALVVALYLFLQ
mmetsp:Transcript_36530/g.79736  ORF Transcript_36530/g.79736 Transcript_36530/m.79736 type:complete len:222 (+) Transcript_36530:58-723(+)